MQLKIRRSSPKRNRTKQALIAAGATVVAAEGVRRARNRKHHDEEPEPEEH